MLRHIHDAHADIIHMHGVWQMPNVYGAWVKKRRKAKLILTPHGMLSKVALGFSPWRKRLFGAAMQWNALAKVDLFHATSEREYLDIRAYGYRQPVAIIGNGIDMPDRVRGKMPLADRQLLYLGRIHPIKRIPDLVHAWSKLEQQHPEWRLRIVGPGELDEIEVLQKLIQSFGLKRVTIESPVFGAEKTTTYAGANIYVLPSGSENFAMTVAEALANAVPVICTKGAPWAGLEQHKCGWWVDVGADAIEKALREAMALSPTALHEMGLNGRAWMERDFSWSDVGLQMEQSLRWILGQGEKPTCVRVN
jgi:glycosyltransferase involved in cell wall biosynthesis